MSFSSFQINELPDDADSDWAIEIVSGSTKYSLVMSDAEMRMLGESMTDAVDGSPTDVDDRRAEDYEVDA